MADWKWSSFILNLARSDTENRKALESLNQPDLEVRGIVWKPPKIRFESDWIKVIISDWLSQIPWKLLA